MPFAIQKYSCRDEDDIKQVPSGSTNCNHFLAISAGIPSMSILVIRSNRLQETVPKPKYGLK